MTLLADGTTGVENGYDYQAAITNRMQPIDDLGTQQNSYVAEAAQRRLVAKAASDEAALIAAKGPDQSGKIVMPVQKTSPATTSTKSSSPAKGNNFASFKAAIAGQESGGSYSAVNKSSGALGKYQVMPSNITGVKSGWDYEALGYDINPSQFLASSVLQEKIATHKLQAYYDKYGAAGAAVAWYAGPGMVGKVGTGSQGAYPTINAYSQSILRRMGL